jgi:hypothetical protein
VLGRFDAYRGASSWDEAMRWLSTVHPTRSIAEIQFWGHGKWGCANFDHERLDLAALSSEHPLHRRLEAVRERTSAQSLWWFRTCETFGAQPGHDFARAWTDWWGCRAAGHTYIIGPLQSGLHTLAPGGSPDWSLREGLLEGSPEEPQKARRSSPRAPNTITCLHGHIPGAY